MRLKGSAASLCASALFGIPSTLPFPATIHTQTPRARSRPMAGVSHGADNPMRAMRGKS